MIVYRTVNENFVHKYLNKEKVEGANINTILNGRDYGIAYNNHNYWYNIKYLHFFRDLIDAVDLKKQRFEENKESCGILFFDIPEKILKQYEGRGGYDFDSKSVTAVEYAIPEKIYNPKWFKKIIDETFVDLKSRLEVDYKNIGFGFYSQSNEEIDLYIKNHSVESVDERDVWFLIKIWYNCNKIGKKLLKMK